MDPGSMPTARDWAGWGVETYYPLGAFRYNKTFKHLFGRANTLGYKHNTNTLVIGGQQETKRFFFEGYEDEIEGNLTRRKFHYKSECGIFGLTIEEFM